MINDTGRLIMKIETGGRVTSPRVIEHQLTSTAVFPAGSPTSRQHWSAPYGGDHRPPMFDGKPPAMVKLLVAPMHHHNDHHQ